MSLQTLIAYADFEVANRPGLPGQQHIAHWAASEIERLMAERETLRELLGAMVSSQHAGPITDDMFAAWSAASNYLSA
jgi:hypothetical protein